MVRMRGVTTMGVGWDSGEGSNLVEPPINLVPTMILRVFAYTSNTLKKENLVFLFDNFVLLRMEWGLFGQVMGVVFIRSSHNKIRDTL
jgi:hypothetical protein